MAALLTEFTDLFQSIVKIDMPQEDKLEQMADVLEGVTDELRTYCSSWKTATQQAEDGARQMAQGIEEIEKTKKHMAEKNEELEKDRRRIAEEDEQLEERRKQIEKKEEQLSQRALELEAKERLFEDRKSELKRKEKVFQQQSAELEQNERNSRDKEARLQAEVKVIASKESELEQKSNALMRREDHIKAATQSLRVTQQTVVAMNESVNQSLAAAKEEHDEDKKLLVVIRDKFQRMKKLKESLLHGSDACSKQLATIGNGMKGIHHFEANHAEILARLKQEILSLSTVLDKLSEQARAIPKDIEAAENDFNGLVTGAEHKLSGVSTSIKTVSRGIVAETERQLGGISTSIKTVSRGVVAETERDLSGISTSIQTVSRGVTEASARLDGASSQIGNVTTELSAKFQQYQHTTNKTLQELTEAMSKARIDTSISRFEANQAKRGLGPTSPQKPEPKRRRQARQSSVGSAGILTSFGPPEPLPADIADRIPSPRGLGRVVRTENTRPEVGSSPTPRRQTGTSVGLVLLGSSTGSQDVLRAQPSSSMDPTTATGENFNPEASSPGTLIQSSQSTVAATDPPGLAEALEEVKDVWRQIEFPVDWDLSASNTLLQGFNKHTTKKLLARSRPAGLLDGSSVQPNCFLCRVSKMKSVLDNGDDKSCSNCQPKEWKCVRVSFVTEGLADIEYDANSGEKRWKLTVREV